MDSFLARVGRSTGRFVQRADWLSDRSRRNQRPVLTTLLLTRNRTNVAHDLFLSFLCVLAAKRSEQQVHPGGTHQLGTRSRPSPSLPFPSPQLVPALSALQSSVNRSKRQENNVARDRLRRPASADETQDAVQPDVDRVEGQPGPARRRPGAVHLCSSPLLPSSPSTRLPFSRELMSCLLDGWKSRRQIQTLRTSPSGRRSCACRRRRSTPRSNAGSPRGRWTTATKTTKEGTKRTEEEQERRGRSTSLRVRMRNRRG